MSNLKTDRGLSTVVGAVLLLGIVVIVAGGVATSLGGVGSDVDTETVTGEFSISADDAEAVTFKHTGGGSVDASRMIINVENSSGENEELDAETIGIPATVGESFDQRESITVNISKHADSVTSSDDYDRIALQYDTGKRIIPLATQSLVASTQSPVPSPPTTPPQPSASAPVDLAAVHGSMSGAGTSSDPWEVTNDTQLQAIAHDTSSDAHYELVNHINASKTSTWNSGDGFDPISEFNGTFDGNENEINGITVSTPSAPSPVGGVFSAVHANGAVKNVGIVNGDVTGQNQVGGVIGAALDTAVVENVYARETTVTGDDVVGGVAGGTSSDPGSVQYINVRSNADVSADKYGGSVIGFAGRGTDTIRDSSAYGSVTVDDSDGGGFAGGIADTVSVIRTVSYTNSVSVGGSTDNFTPSSAYSTSGTTGYIDDDSAELDRFDSNFE